jgi:Heterokaryon incompatibility protein (HET)
MSEYLYSELSVPDRIRLLRLLPSKVDQDHLQGELFEYALRPSDNGTRPYEALSYVWFDKRSEDNPEDNPQSIIIEDQRLKITQSLRITQNLHAALMHLRDPDIPRTIWVDAVCINQDSNKEKESQIPLMADIYAKASCVVVWLGPAENESDQVLEKIRLVGENPSMLAEVESVQRAVVKLLQRKWFRRIWVRNSSSKDIIQIS